MKRRRRRISKMSIAAMSSDARNTYACYARMNLLRPQYRLLREEMATSCQENSQDARRLASQLIETENSFELLCEITIRLAAASKINMLIEDPEHLTGDTNLSARALAFTLQSAHYETLKILREAGQEEALAAWLHLSNIAMDGCLWSGSGSIDIEGAHTHSCNTKANKQDNSNSDSDSVSDNDSEDESEGESIQTKFTPVREPIVRARTAPTLGQVSPPPSYYSSESLSMSPSTEAAAAAAVTLAEVSELLAELSEAYMSGDDTVYLALEALSAAYERLKIHCQNEEEMRERKEEEEEEEEQQQQQEEE